jgi:hypothetical protein
MCAPAREQDATTRSQRDDEGEAIVYGFTDSLSGKDNTAECRDEKKAPLRTAALSHHRMNRG